MKDKNYPESIKMNLTPEIMENCAIRAIKRIKPGLDGLGKFSDEIEHTIYMCFGEKDTENSLALWRYCCSLPIESAMAPDEVLYNLRNILSETVFLKKELDFSLMLFDLMARLHAHGFGNIIVSKIKPKKNYAWEMEPQ